MSETILIVLICFATFCLVGISLILASIYSDITTLSLKDLFFKMLGAMLMIFLYSAPFLLLLSLFWVF